MLKIIRNLLQTLIDNIDAGNSNITDSEAMNIISIIKSFTDKTERLSKYEACKHLNISRATFDNYVRLGKIPRGHKEAGFKELSWSKKDLENITNTNN